MSDGKSDEDGMRLVNEFSQINYARSIELRFHMNEDDERAEEVNRITIPLMIVEYGTLNLTKIAASASSSTGGDGDESSAYNIDFTFKIKFIKRPNLSFFFQIVLPLLMFLAFFYALMQTFFYKMRQQKAEYDFAILLNFAVNLLGNFANAFFAFVLALVCYVFFVYKTQTSEIKIMLPLEKEQRVIGILLVLALIFKVRPSRNATLSASKSPAHALSVTFRP